MAVLLHYFYLAAFFMMLAEGIQLFVYVAFVFHAKRIKETALLIVTAWGTRIVKLLSLPVRDLMPKLGYIFRLIYEPPTPTVVLHLATGMYACNLFDVYTLSRILLKIYINDLLCEISVLPMIIVAIAFGSAKAGEYRSKNMLVFYV